MASSSYIILQNGSNNSSSSTSVPVKPKKRNDYDVFVSFRGQDTRYSFTDHLFAALQRNSITAFRDDTKLKKGESIAPELRRAIKASQIFIVVFSKNYASSTWCLGELENILERVWKSKKGKKRVLPIFYDVDPSEVRKQSGSYLEAFAKYEEKYKKDSEIVQRWRAALTYVANLSGWDIRDKAQSTEIEKIVEEVMNILGNKCSSTPCSSNLQSDPYGSTPCNSSLQSDPYGSTLSYSIRESDPPAGCIVQ